MSIIPPGYAELVIPHRHPLLARSALITMGIQLNDVPDFAGVNFMQLAYTDNVFAVLGDSQVIVGPSYVRVGQDGGEALTVTGTATYTGSTGTSAAINAGQALLVHKLSSRGGRRGKGRMYVPWVIEEGNVDDVGRLAPSTLSGAQGVMDDFLTALNAVTEVDAMVLLHSPSGEGVANPTPPGLPNVVNSLLVDAIVGSQRRRLGR